MEDFALGIETALENELITKAEAKEAIRTYLEKQGCLKQK